MNTISVAGSHDPLIDEIADIIKQRWQSIEVASSHVGSMGGIMAVKRSEAQMGGIHLLDSNTGQYNLPYLEKYFPNGGVVLIEGVKRIQGIMVKRGNPLGIRGFTDLSARGISFVNRQKGSGTRILFDYLCEENHMDSEKIYGYQREEYTHTGVAAQIAAGTADAGLGIFSSAKIYGLDFIPVGHEEYDILADKESLSYDKVKKFIEVLHSGQLKRRLCELGGYEVTNPGTIKKEL
jgi:putative molybdopterin biosynthesis protein